MDNPDVRRALCHAIGPVKHSPNWNTIEELMAFNGDLCFDGVHVSVWQHREELKRKVCKIFPVGLRIGEMVDMEDGTPPQQMCTPSQLEDLKKLGFRLGWHTWSHVDLSKLSDVDALRELRSPFGTKMVAYPYGACDDRIMRLAKEAGNTSGYCAGGNGDDSPMRLKRHYI